MKAHNEDHIAYAVTNTLDPVVAVATYQSLLSSYPLFSAIPFTTLKPFFSSMCVSATANGRRNFIARPKQQVFIFAVRRGINRSY
ncbi:hypothetical protein [Methylocucumis oryzae]|uniref:hypothetical protein n=1 Tax=Methylocucumis oryzae TaxID=1632867 RepID=UPI00103DB900|nr:hypothetical protein [Methylocucumis oryzae]